jgi:hypothetical protein
MADLLYALEAFIVQDKAIINSSFNSFLTLEQGRGRSESLNDGLNDG